MANNVIAGTGTGGATALPIANSIDGSADYIAIYTASATATQAINRNTYLGISSSPVGLTDIQTLTNKTLTSPTLSSPVISGTITGTYTIGGTPTFPSSVVTLTGSQTLTSKTLTSPTINTPTITNASITADSIAGYTSSNTGTIYGLSVSSGKIGTSGVSDSAITTALLADGSVTPNKLSIGAQSTNSTASNTTTSTSFGNLTNSVAVTITVGSDGYVLVGFGATIYNSGANGTTVGVAVSGTNTIVADSNNAIYNSTVSTFAFGRTLIFTGLNPGSTTFTLQAKVTAGTGNINSPTIYAIPF